jgi:hypothetical protein
MFRTAPQGDERTFAVDAGDALLPAGSGLPAMIRPMSEALRTCYGPFQSSRLIHHHVRGRRDPHPRHGMRSTRCVIPVHERGSMVAVDPWQ